MLYSKNNEIVLSSASLVGLETAMDEDHAAFLEQGVKNETCLGSETPILSPSKKKYGKIAENKSSKESSEESECNVESSMPACILGAELNSSIDSAGSTKFNLKSNINKIRLLTESTQSESTNLDSHMDDNYFSQTSQDYFFHDDDNNKADKCYNDVQVKNVVEQGINLDLERMIPQPKPPFALKSQAGCASSESSTEVSLLATQTHDNNSPETIQKYQSTSQPTAEVPINTSLNSTYQGLILPTPPKLNNLQVIIEGAEIHFCPTDIPNDEMDLDLEKSSTMLTSKSMDRLLSEAAQFAEAVGEIPPSNVSEISRRIIDNDEDDEDDDESDVCSVSIVKSPDVKKDSHQIDTLKSMSKSSSESNLKAISKVETSVEDPEHFLQDQIVLPEQNPPLVRRRSRSMDNINDRKFAESSKHPHVAREHEQTLLSGMHGSSCGESTTYVYRGLISNPPAIIKRGIQRGNYALLHRKAWLEVSDKYHRYGKNLRLYYKHWENLSHPTNMFFDWLDSKGEAAGQPLPNLEECPRSQLDSDTVLYITNQDVIARHQLSIEENKDGIMYIADVDGKPVNTGDEGWIFVLRDSVLYGAPKVTSVTGKSKQRFHHSSFFGGKAVAAAGIIITDKNGLLQRLYPHSGHYRPGEAHMHRMLFHLQKGGIDLYSFQVDTQQIMHVCRKERQDTTPMGGKSNDSKRTLSKKSKKVNNLHLRSGTTVASFLAHKAHMIGHGVFMQIQKIRRMQHPILVRDILENLHIN